MAKPTKGRRRGVEAVQPSDEPDVVQLEGWRVERLAWTRDDLAWVERSSELLERAAERAPGARERSLVRFLLDCSKAQRVAVLAALVVLAERQDADQAARAAEDAACALLTLPGKFVGLRVSLDVHRGPLPEDLRAAFSMIEQMAPLLAGAAREVTGGPVPKRLAFVVNLRDLRMAVAALERSALGAAGLSHDDVRHMGAADDRAAATPPAAVVAAAAGLREGWRAMLSADDQSRLAALEREGPIVGSAALGTLWGKPSDNARALYSGLADRCRGLAGAEVLMRARGRYGIA